MEEAACSLPKRTENRSDVRVSIGEPEVHVELVAIGVLGHAVVVVSACQQEVIAALEARADGQACNFSRLVSRFLSHYLSHLYYSVVSTMSFEIPY